MTILDQLADHARERVEGDISRISRADMKALALEAGSPGKAGFSDAVRKPGLCDARSEGFSVQRNNRS